MLLPCWLLLFVKQKTAYEMRISDWSSDVCSSDLLERIGTLRRQHTHHGRRGPIDANFAADHCRIGCKTRAPQTIANHHHRVGTGRKIGVHEEERKSVE